MSDSYSRFMSTEDTQLITFRVKQEDYDTFEKIARILFDNEKIKSPKASGFCKVASYVIGNQFLQIEAAKRQAAGGKEGPLV